MKISGYRIELGEIETVLLHHPSVKSTAVLARQDTPGEKKLAAYVVAGSQGCSINDLRVFLQAKLPAYMVPSAFVLMDSLPLSPNGKVDRAALPAPEAIQVSQAEGPNSPQSEIEQKIASVWQRVLGLKQVSVEDNFFDVGGDSLQLLEAHAELQKILSPDLVITDLFEYPTVRALAKHVGGTQSSSGISEAQERARKQQQVWARQKPSRVSQIS